MRKQQHSQPLTLLKERRLNKPSVFTSCCSFFPKIFHNIKQHSKAFLKDSELRNYLTKERFNPSHFVTNHTLKEIANLTQLFYRPQKKSNPEVFKKLSLSIALYKCNI